MAAEHCQRMQVHAHPHLPTIINDSYPHLPRSWMASSNLFSSMAFCTSFVLRREGSQVVKKARLYRHGLLGPRMEP